MDAPTLHGWLIVEHNARRKGSSTHFPNPSKEDIHTRFLPFLLQKQQSGETVSFIMQVNNTKTKLTMIGIAKDLIDWAPEKPVFEKPSWAILTLYVAFAHPLQEL